LAQVAPLLEYVALLRGINVGGHKPVAMSELRDLLAGLGFVDVRSLLQSGNLVLRGDARTGGRLERTLETEAAQRLGLETDCFVRTATEWKAVVSRNPFPTEAERDPAHLVVMFLKEPPKAKDVAALRAAITGPEIVRATGWHARLHRLPERHRPLAADEHAHRAHARNTGHGSQLEHGPEARSPAPLRR